MAFKVQQCCQGEKIHGCDVSLEKKSIHRQTQTKQIRDEQFLEEKNTVTGPTFFSYLKIQNYTIFWVKTRLEELS